MQMTCKLISHGYSYNVHVRVCEEVLRANDIPVYVYVLLLRAETRQSKTRIETRHSV